MSTDDRMETITDPALIRATDEPDKRGDFPCCTTPAPAGAAVALDLDRIADGARMGFKATPDLTAALVAEVRRLAGIEAHRDNLAAMIRRLSEFLDGRGLESWKHGACWAAEDAIKTLIARAESAEAEVVTLRDTLARRTDSHTQLVRENETLRAKVAAVEAKRDEFADLLARALPAVAALARVEALGDSNPDHADTCGSMLTPGAGYPCSCWQADLRAALATTGEGE